MESKWIYVVLLLVAAAIESLQFSDRRLDALREQLLRARGRARCPSIASPRNGRAKVRNRGTSVQFRCKGKYQLFGDSFATCINNRWNKPIPVCVINECPAITLVQGKLTRDVTHGGAVMTYSCTSGTALLGTRTIYCDGNKWSGKPPHCMERATDSFCDFEDEKLCGWMNTPSGDHFDWYRRTGSTPTHATGPSWDHTLGKASATGHYLFIESSPPRSPDQAAQLWSPPFPPSITESCFTFWYHMYGKYKVGRLTVYITGNDSVANLTSSWTLEGNQGDEWLSAQVPILPKMDSFQIVIEAMRNNSYFSDIAVDDVNLLKVPCIKTTTATTPTTVRLTTSTARPSTTVKRSTQVVTTTTSKTTTGSTTTRLTPHTTTKATNTTAAVTITDSSTQATLNVTPSSELTSKTMTHVTNVPEMQIQSEGGHVDVALVMGVLVACVVAVLAGVVTLYLVHRRRRLLRAADQEMDPIANAQAYTY